MATKPATRTTGQNCIGTLFLLHSRRPRRCSRRRSECQGWPPTVRSEALGGKPRTATLHTLRPGFYTPPGLPGTPASVLPGACPALVSRLGVLVVSVPQQG